MRRRRPMSTAEHLPPTDALQQQPTPQALPAPDALPAPPSIALPLHDSLWTKLHLLLHAHKLAAESARRQWAWGVVLVLVALLLAIPAGVLAGIGVGTLVFDNPDRHAQRYDTWGQPSTFY